MSDPSSGALSHPTFTLWAQGQQVALSEGVALQRAQFPMLVPANPGGPVALVNANPHDPTQLGLRNLTTSPWTATLPDGSQKEIGTDKSVRLAAGTIIQAGPLQWEVRAQTAPALAQPPVAPIGQAAPQSPFVQPPAGAGFVAASEPAIQPQPAFPAQAGFVQASAPAAPLQPNPGFVVGTPPPPVGFVQAGQPAPVGFVQDNALVPGQPPKRPGGAARNIVASSSLSFSQILPVAGERQVLMSKGFLLPGIATVALVALLSYAGSLQDDQKRFGLYADTLALYIGAGALFFVYRLCGKAKPWWVLLLAGVFTALVISPQFEPLFWSLIYPLFNMIGGGDAAAQGSVLTQFFHFTFTVGLREEFVKAIPVFIAMFAGWRLASPLREKVGVFEPLDGILLGAASGLGFTMLETLGQYIPDTINHVASMKTGDSPEALLLVGQGLGLEQLIVRVLGVISGHMAYSGYFGYFIGLSALKPKHRWKILGIGWLTAALIHGLWDTTCDRPGSGPYFMVIIGLVAYAFLISAILKARQLSPDRVHNFATQIKGVQ